MKNDVFFLSFSWKMFKVILCYQYESRGGTEPKPSKHQHNLKLDKPSLFLLYSVPIWLGT